MKMEESFLRKCFTGKKKKLELFAGNSFKYEMASKTCLANG
jgi:hypothetical protein